MFEEELLMMLSWINGDERVSVLVDGEDVFINWGRRTFYLRGSRLEFDGGVIESDLVGKLYVVLKNSLADVSISYIGFVLMKIVGGGVVNDLESQGEGSAKSN